MHYTTHRGIHVHVLAGMPWGDSMQVLCEETSLFIHVLSMSTHNIIYMYVIYKHVRNSRDFVV